MTNGGNSGQGGWKEQTRQLGAELSHMMSLRRELAALEIDHDRQLIRRCLVAGSVGAVLALSGTPLLLQVAAEGLAARHGA